MNPFSVGAPPAALAAKASTFGLTFIAALMIEVTFNLAGAAADGRLSGLDQTLPVAGGSMDSFPGTFIP